MTEWQHSKECIVVSYSGLRGAVGLVLALSVGEEESIPLAVRDRFTFFMSGTKAYITGLKYMPL